MDVAIVKNQDGYVAFSLFPVGVIGWGKSKNDAVKAINDNVYDYCNWLSKPLPKNPEATVKEEYSGEIVSVAFKSDDKSLVKKYAEVVVQTAFSFKSLTDSLEKGDREESLIAKLFSELKIAEGEGIIGRSAELCERGDIPLLREFIFKAQKTAKELMLTAKERGLEFFNTFCFDFT